MFTSTETHKICKCGGENIATRMVGDESYDICLECGAFYHEYGPDPESLEQGRHILEVEDADS